MRARSGSGKQWEEEKDSRHPHRHPASSHRHPRPRRYNPIFAFVYDTFDILIKFPTPVSYFAAKNTSPRKKKGNPGRSYAVKHPLGWFGL